MRPRMNWPGLDEAALIGVAQALGRVMGASGVVYLEGDLGAGKSTFVRALLGARGVGERIKSPTYSLIETYAVAGNSAHHLDSTLRISWAESKRKIVSQGARSPSARR